MERNRGFLEIAGSLFIIASVIFACIGGLQSINADKGPILTYGLIIYGVWLGVTAIIWLIVHPAERK